MEAESSLTQSALTFGDVTNNNIHNNNNIDDDDDNDERHLPPSWQRGRVRNHHPHHPHYPQACHACFGTVAVVWHVVVGGCALLYAVVWQRHVQQQPLLPEDVAWMERSITILWMVAGVEGWRALLWMVGLRSKRRADHYNNEEEEEEDCPATLNRCVLWLASLVAAVSAMIHLVLALIVLFGQGSIHAFVTNHHVSCENHDENHPAATLPALACPIVLSLLQNHLNILWWIFLGNSVWDCVQWQWIIQWHRQALLQPLYGVLEEHPEVRPTVVHRRSWQQSITRHRTTTPRIRPWWWKSRQEEEAAVANRDDMFETTTPTTLTESLLDQYNQHPPGVPSWVTSSSSSVMRQHPDPERLESSTIWRLFGIHRASRRPSRMNDDDDNNDNDDDDDDAAEFESVREEWASRSSEDPLWWSRDHAVTTTTTTP